MPHLLARLRLLAPSTNMITRQTASVKKCGG
jgi:hypothetical protein